MGSIPVLFSVAMISMACAIHFRRASQTLDDLQRMLLSILSGGLLSLFLLGFLTIQVFLLPFGFGLALFLLALGLKGALLLGFFFKSGLFYRVLFEYLNGTSHFTDFVTAFGRRHLYVGVTSGQGSHGGCHKSDRPGDTA